MDSDEHTITLTEHELNIIAVALMNAYTLILDNEDLTTLGKISFAGTIAKNGATNCSETFNSLNNKIIEPYGKRLTLKMLNDKYV